MTDRPNRTGATPWVRTVLCCSAILFALIATVTVVADSSVSVKKAAATRPAKVQHVEVAADPVAGSQAAEGSEAAAVQPTPKAVRLDAAGAPAPVSTLAAPANDECAGAVAIPDGPYPVVSAVTNILEATPQGVDSLELSCGTSDYTVWYSFTPSVTTSYTISTCQGNGATGSTVYDTLVGVFPSTGGACPAGAETACNDIPTGCASTGGGAPYWDQAITSAVLNAGTTYFIVAAHWAGDVDGVVPGFDDIAIRIDRSDAPANDTCSAPTPLALNQKTAGTSAGAANDYQSPATAACYPGLLQTPSTAPGRDVVYSFTAPAAGDYSFRYIQDAANPPLRGQDPVLYASSTCPASGTVGCLKGANREFTTSGLNKAEEIYCLPMGSGETVYVFFDDHAAGNAGGFHHIEVFPCEREIEPNGDLASATPLDGCFLEGAIDPSGDVDFYSLGTPPAGARVFAAVRSEQMRQAVSVNSTANLAMRVTSTTDTLQFDDNDGTSIHGSNSPVISGAVTTGTETFLRLNNQNADAVEPYQVYARVETSPAEMHVEEDDLPDGFLSRFQARPLTGGGYVRGVSRSGLDFDCFRFVAREGDELVMFAGGNPDRVAGASQDSFPLIFDLESGYSLTRFGGQVLRNVLTPSPGTLTGTTPSITSNVFIHRSSYTGTKVVCFSAVQPADPSPNYPLPWHGSLSLNCGAIPPASASNADVSIVKTGPVGPVPTSGEVEYTVTVTNNSATDIAQDIRLTDQLPPELSFQALLVNDGFGAENVDCLAVPDVNEVGGLIDCTNYSLAPGASSVWTIRATVNECIGAGLTVSNTMSVLSTASVDSNSDNNSSTWSFQTEDGPCDDGNPCTDDACVGGACVGTSDDTNTCDDSNVCTDDACSAGACVGSPNTAPCSDGLFCTIEDTCGGGTCNGTPNPCNDNDPCTIDQCEESSGCFNSFSEGELCDDGNPCTLIDICLLDPGGCVGFEEQTCDDNDPCTDNVCDGQGGCLFPPISCDDGNACTVDSCDAQQGCVYTPVSCDDGSACTTDACDTASGCVYTPITCDDANECTTDTCDSGSGCVYTPIEGCGEVCDVEPNPRNAGYWRRLCRGPHGGDEITLADAACVAGQGGIFADVDEVKDICDTLERGNGVSGVCDKAEGSLMALALNLCHARLCDGTAIDSQYSDNTTVGESYDEANGLLTTPSSANCSLARSLSDEINNGRAIDVDTVGFTKISGGGARVNWQAMGGGTTPVIHYNVWRRVAGSGNPFAKIGETASLTFDDTTPGDFEYEVTPVR